MLKIKLENNKNLIITTDNAGSIGLKENDTVSSSYEILAFYTLRNAIMENLSFKTRIIGVTFSNFCGENNYRSLIKGMNNIIKQFDYEIPITASTESNFEMKESALGITVVGIKGNEKEYSYDNYAVIGKPLVGSEVTNSLNDIVKMSEFIYLNSHPDVSKISTVGSLGIHDRGMKVFNKSFSSKDIDVYKSAGPSTCIIIEYRTLDNIDKSILDKLYKLRIT